jgi:uncharacterized protein YqhQ
MKCVKFILVLSIHDGWNGDPILKTIFEILKSKTQSLQFVIFIFILFPTFLKSFNKFTHFAQSQFIEPKTT